jgi:hypothetical protein
VGRRNTQPEAQAEPSPGVEDERYEALIGTCEILDGPKIPSQYSSTYVDLGSCPSLSMRSPNVT